MLIKNKVFSIGINYLNHGAFTSLEDKAKEVEAWGVNEI